MKITKKLTMDLMQCTSPPIVNAVQDDRYTRDMEISLYADGTAWDIPEDTAVLIRYRKSDGTGGEYDTLPDGSNACTIRENVLIIALAPQVLTAAGPVVLSVTLIRNAFQISTFDIMIHVSQLPASSAAESEPYHHISHFIPGPASGTPGQYFRISAVDETGKVRAVEAVDPPESSSGTVDAAVVEQLVEAYLLENPPVCPVTINGKLPDETGNFLIHTLSSEQIAQLHEMLN